MYRRQEWSSFREAGSEIGVRKQNICLAQFGISTEPSKNSSRPLAMVCYRASSCSRQRAVLQAAGRWPMVTVDLSPLMGRVCFDKIFSNEYIAIYFLLFLVCIHFRGNSGVGPRGTALEG
jgi:hypothetical protein